MTLTTTRITDPDDERLRDYRHLTDVQLRRRLEPAAGLYMAESMKVIERAFRGGHRPRSVLLTDRWLPDHADLLEAATERFGPFDVYVGDQEVVGSITGFRLHRGALAAMHRPVPLTVEHVLGRATRVAVLEDLVDHTNVGAIVRAAAGLGFDGLLVSPRCADPLYRRAVRVSMGTVFDLPWARVPTWPGDLSKVRAAGFSLLALTLSDTAVALDALPVGPDDRIAVMLGAEGDGLSAAAVAAADLQVTIPMARGVDSLNVGSAAAVAFWALRHRPGWPGPVVPG